MRAVFSLIPRILAARLSTSQFVLLYVSIVLVNLLKNVLILYFFFTDVRHGHRLDTYEYFLAILLCVDVVLLTVRGTDHSTAGGKAEEKGQQ